MPQLLEWIGAGQFALLVAASLVTNLAAQGRAPNLPPMPNLPPTGDVFQSGSSPDDRAKYVHGNWFDRCAYDRDHVDQNPLTRQYGQPDYVPIDRQIMNQYVKCAVDACAVNQNAVCWGKKNSGKTVNIGCRWDRTSLICQGLPQECVLQGNSLRCDATNAQAGSNPPPVNGPEPQPLPYRPPPPQTGPQPSRSPGLPAPIEIQPVMRPPTTAQPQTPPGRNNPPAPARYPPQWLGDDGSNSTYRFADGKVWQFPDTYGSNRLQRSPPPTVNHATSDGKMTNLTQGFASYRSGQGPIQRIPSGLLLSPAGPAAPAP